ncbi:MAG: hypothetical protein AB7O24_10120 [Kofleriaceae bacterium]
MPAAPAPPARSVESRAGRTAQPQRSTADELTAALRKIDGELKKANAALRSARTDEDKQRLRTDVADLELERKQLRALLETEKRTRNEKGVIHDAVAPECLQNPLSRGCY